MRDVVEWAPEDSPRADEAAVRALIERCESQQFEHAAEFLGLLRRNSSDECQVAIYAPVALSQMRFIYRRRAEHLKKLASREPERRRLAREVESLADTFDNANDAHARFARVLLTDGTAHVLFELVESGRVAGCLRTADRRVVR